MSKELEDRLLEGARREYPGKDETHDGLMEASAACMKRYRLKLIEIRDVARVSEGVEFYAMLAQKALDGEE